MAYQKLVVPQAGEKIQLRDGVLHVPDNPIVCFIEGDGTGVDIWAASQPVLDAAVEAGLADVRLVHGRGIGVQRRAVQARLAAHPAVIDFRDDPRAHLGATIARLRPPAPRA